MLKNIFKDALQGAKDLATIASQTKRAITTSEVAINLRVGLTGETDFINKLSVDEMLEYYSIMSENVDSLYSSENIPQTNNFSVPPQQQLPSKPQMVKREKDGIYRPFKAIISENRVINFSDPMEISAPMVGIIGQSGSGKTQFLKTIISQGIIGSKIVPFIIDNKGDFRPSSTEDFPRENGISETINILTDTIPFNPLIPLEGESNTIVAYRIAGIISSVIGATGDSQFSDIKESVQAYLDTCVATPNFRDLRDYLRDIGLTGAYFKLINSLVDFEVFSDIDMHFMDWFNATNGVIIDTKDIYEIARDIYPMVATIFLEFTYKGIMANGKSRLVDGEREINYMMVIDEASDITRNYNQVLINSLTKLREFGCAVFLGTQQLDHLMRKNYNYLNDCVKVWVGKTSNIDRIPTFHFREDMISGEEWSRVMPYWEFKQKRNI